MHEKQISQNRIEEKPKDFKVQMFSWLYRKLQYRLAIFFLFPFESQYHIVKKDDDRNFDVMSQYFGQSLIQLIKTYA